MTFIHSRVAFSVSKGTLGKYEILDTVRGFAKLKKFKKSKNNLEVGGWVQVPFG